MKFNFIRNEKSSYYEVTDDMISQAENEMKLKLPNDLILFYREVGYGFLGSENGNANRLMDPVSVCDFRLRQYDYEFFPDIHVYDSYEDGKLVFFEQNVQSLMSIEITDNETSRIYYYDTVIANSLEEFMNNMANDEYYYFDIFEKDRKEKEA